MALRTSIFCKLFSFVFHSPGRGSSWADVESKIFLNFLWKLIKYSRIPAKLGNFWSIYTSCLCTWVHSRSSSQSVGFYIVSISPEGPAKKNLHSSTSILLSPNRIFTQRSREKRSLLRSNKERQTFWYRAKVWYSFSSAIRSVTSSDGYESFTEEAKSL